MKASSELIDKIAGAVSALEGLGLESSVADGVRWPGRSTAIELGTGIVEIRVVATALPLKTLLGRLAEAVEPLLADTPWAGATIRMVVTQLAASAFETD